MLNSNTLQKLSNPFKNLKNKIMSNVRVMDHIEELNSNLWVRKDYRFSLKQPNSA